MDIGCHLFDSRVEVHTRVTDLQRAAPRKKRQNNVFCKIGNHMLIVYLHSNIQLCTPVHVSWHPQSSRSRNLIAENENENVDVLAAFALKYCSRSGNESNTVPNQMRVTQERKQLCTRNFADLFVIYITTYTSNFTSLKPALKVIDMIFRPVSSMWLVFTRACSVSVPPHQDWGWERRLMII